MGLSDRSWITVLPPDISFGVRHDAEACPISRAVRPLMDNNVHPSTCVGYNGVCPPTISAVDHDGDAVEIYYYPRLVAQMADSWDDGGDFYPVSFLIRKEG